VRDSCSPLAVEKDQSGATPPRASGGGDNIVDLLRDLVSQGSHLAEQQLRLMKVEVRESAHDLKTAAVSFIGAAVVGIAGLGVLLMGVAYILARQMGDLGLATLIVGAVTLLIAYFVYRSAAKKMAASNLAPDRSQRTLQRTPDAVRGKL
jgi:uncharacterized membrane protein YqjE